MATWHPASTATRPVSAQQQAPGMGTGTEARAIPARTWPASGCRARTVEDITRLLSSIHFRFVPRREGSSLIAKIRKPTYYIVQVSFFILFFLGLLNFPIVYFFISLFLSYVCRCAMKSFTIVIPLCPHLRFLFPFYFSFVPPLYLSFLLSGFFSCIFQQHGVSGEYLLPFVLDESLYTYHHSFDKNRVDGLRGLLDPRARHEEEGALINFSGYTILVFYTT